jgi:hypothetical protein
MRELNQLTEQQDKVNKFIKRLLDLKEMTISNLIAVRKEIVSLKRLVPNYPNSVEIPRKLKNCDEALQRGTEILRGIETQLFQHQQNMKTMERLIQRGEPLDSVSGGDQNLIGKTFCKQTTFNDPGNELNGFLQCFWGC